MNTAKVNAYAKLNLTLDVTGRTGGYHLIDSLVCTIDLFDRVIVRRRRDGLVGVTMHGMDSESIPPGQNNALRAGEAFVSAFGTTGAEITIYKNIPVGAGLGGSSADAAGVLRAMAMLYGVRDEAKLKEIADGLGSDTGYLLTGGFARMRGRGEKLEFLDGIAKMHFLLLCPRSEVSTAECYGKFDELPPPGAGRTERALELLRDQPMWAAKFFSNDLSPAAAQLNEDAAEALVALKRFSPAGASMTGSGSASFALFETRELCEWAKSRYRGKCRAFCADSILPRETERKEWRNPFALSEAERENKDD